MNENILGPLKDDNGEARWFASEEKDKFVRYYYSDFRELVHLTTIDNADYDGIDYDGRAWTVSLGYHDYFSKGYRFFETSREAKDWADNRDDVEWYYLECERDNLIKRSKASAEPVLDNCVGF